MMRAQYNPARKQKAEVDDKRSCQEPEDVRSGVTQCQDQHLRRINALTEIITYMK